MYVVSGVTGGGGGRGVECIFHREIVADLPGKEGAKKNGEENKKRKRKEAEN